MATSFPALNSHSKLVNPDYRLRNTTEVGDSPDAIQQFGINILKKLGFNDNDLEAVGSALGMFGQGGPGVGSSYAMMPALGKNNPRIQELYKKLLGYYPYGKVELNRIQKEPEDYFTSHDSRGGIFALTEDNLKRMEQLRPANIDKKDLNFLTKEINLENPIVSFKDSLVGPAFKYETIPDPKNFYSIFKGTKREAKLIGRLRSIAQQNIEAKRAIYGAEDLVLPDLLASIFAKRANADALIAASLPFNTYKGPKSSVDKNEIMLMPDKKVGSKIMRTK
jgi:hypothetical protein